MLMNAGSSGRVVYTGLVPKRYNMRVVAVNTREDRAIVSRRFQVHSDPDYCTMHLVNEGVTVTGNNVTVEFAVVGPAEGVTCQLDSQPLFSCEYIAPFSTHILAFCQLSTRIIPTLP